MTWEKSENGAMFVGSVSKAAAQLVMPRIEGTRLDDAAYRAELSGLVDAGIGGFILFGGDVQGTPARLAEILAGAEVPVMISSDVERGLGQQLEGGTRFPSQRAVASAVNRRSKKDAALLDAMLDAVRTETRTAGIHVVFSPVMDVNNNPDNPIICTRSFGEDAETVEWFGSRYIRGLQRQRRDGTLGLLACAKHFPGHGDTDQDSHSVLPVIRADKARLNRVELPPFREAVKAGVGTVMIAHLLVPALDAVKPVTFSKKTVTALLREGMAFDGLIVSDALDMGALAGEYPQDEIAVRAVEAGMDILLHPADARAAIGAVVRAVEQGRLTEERVQESVDRILHWKKRLGLFSSHRPSLARGEHEGGAGQKLNYEKHRQVADELASRAVTVRRGRTGAIRGGEGASCVVLDDDGRNEGGPFVQAMIASFGEVHAATLTPGTCGEGAVSHAGDRTSGPLVVAIFSRISASKGRSGISPKLREAAFELLKRAKAAGRQSAVISFDSPYLLDQFRDADLLIAGYDRMEASQRAAAGLLSGIGGP